MRDAIRVLFLLALSAALPGQADPYAEDVAIAERYLQRGEVAKANEVFTDILADWEDTKGTPDAPGDAAVLACRRGLAQIEVWKGAYDEAIETFEGAGSAAGQNASFVALAMEAHTRRGRYAKAEDLASALKRSSVQVRVRLGEVLDTTGRRTDAESVWSEVTQRRPESAEDMAWTARAHMNLGGRAAVENASRLLVEAIRKAPDLPEPRILYGRLRYEVYGEWSGAESGESVLKEVLRRNGEQEAALVELFRIRRSNYLLDFSKTNGYLQRALAANPNSVPALLQQATIEADDRRLGDAAKTLQRALDVNPRDPEVLAQSAAVASLRGKAEESRGYVERLRGLNAESVAFDLALGDRLVALYRFGDAVEPYRRALAAQPEFIPALHGLAKALIYDAKGEEGAALLRKAKELQPGFVHPWRNNAIAVQELLEEEYDTVEEDGFVFWLHRRDQEVLARYLVPTQLEARKVLSKKYGVNSDRDVRVEVFRRWDDFSVRTIGFRGFTALGACFGPLITLVSPVDSDLRQQEYMWNSTVWHEYAHVLTLERSRRRVPRWLTEGFSVYEERERDPSWERGMLRELLDAHHNDDIPPVRLLNRLFRGSRILFGYYQGGLIVEFLATRYGFDKVLALLDAYGRDLSTEGVFQAAFGISTREFDRDFRAWIVRDKLTGLQIVPRWSERGVKKWQRVLLGDRNNLEAHTALAWSAVQRGVGVDAAQHLREILRQDPSNGQAALIRGELARQRGDNDEAIGFYEKAFAAGVDDFETRMRYGQILVGRSQLDEAAAQFQAAKRCWPNCTDAGSAPELMLARLYREAGRETDSMMELKAFCDRTARAYDPRLQLAAHAKASRDRRQEAELLEEAIAIDPFHRRVHLMLGDAYEALGKDQLAAREFEMALAVLPALDREWLGRDDAPQADSPEFREDQATVAVRLGRILKKSGREAKAKAAFERALVESPDGDAAAEARRELGR